MEGRAVIIYKWVKKDSEPFFTKVEDARGCFQQYGVDYEEFENGPGNFSTAIVELRTGEIRNVPVELCEFI